MDPPATVLVVDDAPANCEMLEAILAPRGYTVIWATSGEEALDKVTSHRPDLVLLDVVMPRLDGYQVCRRLRTDPASSFLPVVMITASEHQERVRALEAGADDFIQKPIDQAELLARVKSLLRIKSYHDTVQAQADELAAWNRALELRVQDQVAELERLGRLRRFLAPQLAELIISAEGESLLESHRREITVLCCELDGFTAFEETTEPEAVMHVLREYYAAVGKLSFAFEGTLGHFAGGGLTVFFNDPLPCPNPACEAVRLAIAIGEQMREVLTGWRKLGHELGIRMGIDLGYATLGTIGFAQRSDYGAVGTVVDLAARLCDEASDGQILVSQRVHAAAEHLVDSTSLGMLALQGFRKPVGAFAIVRARARATPSPLAGNEPSPASVTFSPGTSPLSEREHEVVALLAQGCSNREVANALTIAEATAVRHVANILNKLGLKSRAQVAIWAVERGLGSRHRGQQHR
ncbi:MAG TPA: response regulator [Ktedonobacterales bacterium]|nr:response regulator [Ktedonobacterales bacterium]